MHVAVNAHLLNLSPGYRAAGITRYIAGLLQGLATLDTGRFTVFLGPQAMGPGLATSPNMTPVASKVRTAGPLARIAWEQFAEPRALATLQPDLLHSLAFVSPLAWQGPTVLTIYDLSFLLFPERFNLPNRLYLSSLTGPSARRARRVAAISQSTRSDVVRLLEVPADRVDVVPPSLDERFVPQNAADVAAFRATRQLPARFVLYLGTLEPRKNLASLIRAFPVVRARLPGLKLVLAGSPGWGYGKITQAIRESGLSDKDVLLPGFVPPEELPLWYSAAEAFVYPSAYEGFGLPVLEALACGTTVVCSNVSSLPEAAGGAALLVDPDDQTGLAAAIIRASEDAGLKAELRQRGLAHAAGFTPAEMGRRMLAVYERALATP